MDLSKTKEFGIFQAGNMPEHLLLYVLGQTGADAVAVVFERVPALRLKEDLVPILVRRGAVTYLDTTWVSAVTGTALFSRRDALQNVTSTEEQRFPWEPVSED